MRAVILAGGLGTRLRPYTTIIPKPLVPVGDRPILEHIMGRLAGCGVTKIDLCVSHLGELIQLYFSQEGMVPPEVELDWHWEDEPQGTAGALRSVPGLDETFIAMNGDILTSLDYRELVASDDLDAVIVCTYDHGAVAGDLAIELNHVGAELDRAQKRRASVLRAVPRGAAVSDAQHSGPVRAADYARRPELDQQNDGSGSAPHPASHD